MGIGAAVAAYVIGTVAKGLTIAYAAYVAVAVAVELAIAAAVSYATSALMGGSASSRGIAGKDLESGSQLRASRSTNAPIPLLYGTVRVGMNHVYLGVSGADNSMLHIIGVLGEGPTHAIKQSNGQDQVFLDDKHYSVYGSSVHYEFFNGAGNQSVCSTLSTAISEWDDPLHYTSYLYIRLEYDSDKFNGLPNITVILEGLEVYNPDTDTAGFSNNPALCAYDMLTRPSTRGGFGLDIWYDVDSDGRIDLTAVEEARAYCATKGWTCDFPITKKDVVLDNFGHILSTFRGALIDSEGSLKLLYLDMNYEAVSMDITDSDIVTNGDISSLVVMQPNIFERPNTIRVKYLSESGNSDGTGTYQAADYVYSDQDAVDEDGDIREKTIELWGVTNLSNVQKLAYYHLERLRNNMTISFKGGSKCLALEPMDLIQVTSTYTGWAQEYFRVISVVYNEDGTVTIGAIQEALSLYNDIYNSSSSEWYTTTLPDIQSTVASVINVSHQEEVYNFRGRTFTRWKIDFDPPDVTSYPWWDYAQIWESVGGQSDYRNKTKSTSHHIIDPVEEGEIYYVKIQSVSVSGAKEDFDSCYTVSKTIIGKTTTPTNLSSMTAVAGGSTVNIYATPITDPDIEGYEVRLGDAWTGGIFISFNKNCSLRLNSVRPGTHTFWMAPKDNAGNYADTPVSATVVVFIPPGYTLPSYGSWAEDFTSGTFNNTEHTTYDSEDCLICSHTGDVLTGDWTSSVYDFGSIEKLRIWGDFRTSFVSSDTTWNGVAPSGVTLTDLDLTRTWAEIFQPSEAGRLSARLYYSTDNVDWTNYVDYFEILCAEVECRYVKVKVTIEDPTVDSNLYLRELNLWAYEGPQ